MASKTIERQEQVIPLLEQKYFMYIGLTDGKQDTTFDIYMEWGVFKVEFLIEQVAVRPPHKKPKANLQFRCLF